MTVAEIKYLIAVNDLSDETKGARLTDIGIKMGVSKVSVYRAMDRLEKSGYIKRDEMNRIVILEYGHQELEIYTKLINFVCNHLVNQFNTPSDIAYNDAIGAVCALSDESLDGIAKFMKEKCDLNK